MEHRWPAWVYDEGEEPDPRFSFANERTYLAWVRTSLAFLAGGVALQALPLGMHEPARVGLSLLFILLGMVAVGTGWWRWARSERSMRRGLPLPGSAITGVLAVCVVAAGVALFAALTFG